MKASSACITLVIGSLSLAAFCGAARAADAGAIALSPAWARATPPGAKVGGGFLTLTNNADTPDRLVSVSSDIAERAEVHEMSVTDGVMHMHELPGLALPPHGAVELKPGSFHVMFVGLKAPLQEGEHFSATFTFEKSGSATVDFTVQSIGAMKPSP